MARSNLYSWELRTGATLQYNSSTRIIWQAGRKELATLFVIQLQYAEQSVQLETEDHLRWTSRTGDFVVQLYNVDSLWRWMVKTGDFVVQL